MRAVCTRGRLEGDENGHAHTRGEGRGSLFSFSPRDGGKNTSSREEALLFRREDPFSTLRQSFFCLLFSLFLFFQTDHPLFRTAPPHRKGVETAGERGEKPQLLCTPEILSQTRYYFSLLSCVHFAVLLLQSCNCARCKVD